MPNGCITETGRATYNSAGTAGQCRVGNVSLRSLYDLAVTPDGGLVVAGANFGLNSSDPVPPPRFTLGGVVAFSRDASGSLTTTGCYSSTRRSLAADPVTTGECATARGLDNAPYNVTVAPDGKHVYFGVGPVESRGSGLALFRVVGSSEPAPGPGVRVTGPAVRENAGTAAFTLKLLSPAIRATTIQYTTYDETATAGSDYAASAGTATIAQGQTTATVTVPITQDTTPEAPETFGLRVTAADGAVLTEPEATVRSPTTTAAPAPPVLSIAGASVVEGNADGAVLRFPLTRTPADAPDVSSLSWSIVGGTATAGEDFTATNGSVTVMPLGGAVIDIPIKGDTVVEGDETIVVRLSGAYAATLGTTDATGTIRNDDTAPVVIVDPPPTGGGDPPRSSPRRRRSARSRRR